jgi:hypothetical protein
VSRWEAWFVHLANLLVGITGIAYAITRYLLTPDDPFAAAHPWQSPAQHLHIVTAPLLVFAVGLIFRGHAWMGLQLDVVARRRSGISLLALSSPMIASGYLLQVAVEPGWRTAWVWIHGVTAALWLVATIVHQLVPKSPPAG